LGHREERKEGSGRWRKGEKKKRRKRRRGSGLVGFERDRTEMTREERRKKKKRVGKRKYNKIRVKNSI
jgi:hypothetical protein